MLTTDIILEVVKTVGPVATGVGGALATLWKTTHSIFSRLSALEKEVITVKEQIQSTLTRLLTVDGRIEDADRRFRSIETVVDGLVEQLPKLTDDLTHTTSGVASIKTSLLSCVTQTSYTKHLERMALLDRRVSELEGLLAQQDATLISFAKEQNEQWQGINRSLGRLEGFIRGRESIHGD